MRMENDIEVLRQLRSDARLIDLGNYVPPLSLFRMFGMARDELAHSRMIASLLDPRRHRNYLRILHPLLHAVSQRLAQDGSPAADVIHQVAHTTPGRVVVRRELYHIDVVVEVDSSAGAIVLGIENKIDAAEQPDQLARYQRALSHAYPDRTNVIVFLCPTTRPPTTASQTSMVPVAVLDYLDLVTAIRNVLDATESNSPDWRALDEIVRHIKEDILSNTGDMEIRRTVMELWKDHGRALSLAMLHRPHMVDVQETYEELLRDHLGDEVEFSYYRSQGIIWEIKMQLTSWKKQDFPFIFMFHLGRIRHLLQVRVFLEADSYNVNQSHLPEWAKRVNEKEGPILDESFKPIRGWGWRRVLIEEEYPQDAVLDEQSFDDETAREAAHRALALVERLRPYVDMAG